MNSQLNPFKTAKHWSFGLFIILFAQMLALIGFMLSFVIVPFYIQTEFNITHPDRIKIWNGLLSGIPTLMLAIFAPIWGALADKSSRKLMLARAFLGGALSIGLMFFAQNIYQFFLLRVLQGITTGSVAAANVFLLSIVPAKHSVLSLALLQISIYIGMAVGPLIGGYIFDALGGKNNFLISSLILLIAAFLILFFTKEPRIAKEKKSIPLQEKVQRKSYLSQFNIFKDNAAIRFLVISMFFCQLSIAIVNTQLSLFVAELNKNFKTVGSVTGILLAYKAIISCLGALFFQKLSNKITLHTTFFISLSGMALCYIPQAFSPHLTFLYFFSIIAGFFAGGTAPIFHAVLNSFSNEKQRGSIFGLSSSLGFIGAAIGPLLASLLAVSFGSWGNRSVFIAGGIILALVVFFAIKKLKKLPLDNQELKNSKALLLK